MREGEEFKKLEDLWTPDLSSTGFSVFDASQPDGVRSLKIEDSYATIAKLQLPDSVPIGVRGYFDAARMLWVYGWFYYPFYTWASFHAGACAEMGLRKRLSDAPHLPVKNLKKRKATRPRAPTFDEMLKEAVTRGWLHADQFTRVRDRRARQHQLVELMRSSSVELPGDQPEPEDLTALILRQLDNFRGIRNWQAHPDDFSYMPSGTGFVSLEFTRDLLVQLFPSESAALE